VIAHNNLLKTGCLFHLSKTQDMFIEFSITSASIMSLDGNAQYLGHCCLGKKSGLLHHNAQLMSFI